MNQAHVVAVILARAGSKGLPNKNVLPVAGRPMIAWTIDHALSARTIDAVCVSTDSPVALTIARRMGAIAIERPPELATDVASVMDATRHAIECYEAGTEARPTERRQAASHAIKQRPVSHVVILYGNVPVRPPGIIDLAVRHLLETGADSVRSLRRVEKQHPDWLHVLVGDRMVQYRRNSIHRRQDLEPLYYHDGAVVAATRSSLFHGDSTDPHSFFGQDRRGVLCEGGPTVDVDTAEDLVLAEAIMRMGEAAARQNSVGTATAYQSSHNHKTTPAAIQTQPAT